MLDGNVVFGLKFEATFFAIGFDAINFVHARSFFLLGVVFFFLDDDTYTTE